MPAAWIVQHELAHVITKLAGEGGIGSIPQWLDEGTATYVEDDWRSRRGFELDRAIKTDSLLNVRGMESMSKRSESIDLFYGQSADIVRFLVERHGPKKFSQLFRTFKDGSTVENALLTVYGFGRDELDNEYRGSLGLSPRVKKEDRSTVIDDVLQKEDTSTAVDDKKRRKRLSVVTPCYNEEGNVSSKRTQEEIMIRRQVIEQQRANPRSGPDFTDNTDFPWEAVLTGLGSTVLIGSILSLLRAMWRREKDIKPTHLTWYPPAKSLEDKSITKKD